MKKLAALFILMLSITSTALAGNNFPVANGTGAAVRSGMNASFAELAAPAYIVKGTGSSTLTGAQFLGNLGTGLIKNTTTTGILSIGVAGTDFVGPATTVNGHPLSGNVIVTDADLSMTDVTTNNVSTAKHGFCPKLPNDITKYFSGNGTWANITGISSGVSSFNGRTGAIVPTSGDYTPTLIGLSNVTNIAQGPANAAYIVQGTSNATLTGAQFLGALATGIVKNTTTTGVLSAAAKGDADYILPDQSGMSGRVLSSNGTTSAWISVSGTGTVTDVSVVTANGLGGTVATSSTTPAITLTTSVNGLVKGNGFALSAAAAGTDYLAPAGDGSALTGITASQVSAVPNTRTVNGLSLTGDISVTDAVLSTSDITTNNVSTAKHGFAPKLPNDSTKFLNGIGAYAVPTATASLTSSTALLGANVALTNANTYYDGPSLSLAAGTWLIMAHVTIGSGTGDMQTAKLWNGTTVIASGQTGSSGTGAAPSVTIPLQGVVTLAGTETWKVSAASSTTGNSILAACPTNGAGNNATGILAVKIAP